MGGCSAVLDPDLPNVSMEGRRLKFGASNASTCARAASRTSTKWGHTGYGGVPDVSNEWRMMLLLRSSEERMACPGAKGPNSNVGRTTKGGVRI